MASGKMSARQKMINLMYLVFIAMLALTMNKEVLSAFGFMNEEISQNNATTTNKNIAFYKSINQKAKDQPDKYLPIKAQADKIKSLSDEFYTYIDSLKAKMVATVDDPIDYESMDKTDYLDSYFFQGDGNTEAGEEFLATIDNYRTAINAVIGNNETLKSAVNRRFDTGVQKNKDGDEIPWIRYRFEGFPMIASLTNLTQMQSNVKNTEGDILSVLLGGKLESEVSLNNYQGIVQLDKTAYFAGEKVTGKIVLGRYDAAMKPDKVTLNGRNYNNVKDGQVILDFSAGNIGDNDIRGSITFTQNGEKVDVPFKSSYTVIPQPNEAVISADKMNVVYRGLDNPISVSLPGVSDNDLKVTTSSGSLSGAKGKFVLKPGAADEVTINVNAKLSSGEVNSPRIFRVKDIPAAAGTVREEFGIVKMPKSSVARVSVGAGLPDFVFDLELEVKSFKVKVPGQLAVIVQGNSLNAAAKKALDRATRGDVITIFDIVAVIKNNTSYTLKKVYPVSIEITN